ncbi:BadF/BadG/BcrA/BcrD ATPase family protein [Arthrobacter sp. AL08]|uniref:N-acetylglucosamine kinase n=1 Tax=unclassified Arthrobacter TaxID=235627 RepID=UPI001CFF8090|nr:MULTISPECIES: BadF/BadG/BcrA/BcrD ATPase family protein [unclassified Arthrobacter]MDI3242112.1 BadF/BadG/BcrA/BcrD ATPase family protein [Arthrobacter sp. AL05]MDI3277948.1 BadF/BadG/BcrA/BcrD ATPase family protein [Arthrobacter sp. AL08]WGZ79440.1 BadF/BadG/BcrA/BcrD ATPase family protein [Arthrobacter sp. EM1]
MSGPTVLAVDLGKTSCRVRLSRGTAVLGDAAHQGSPGLAEDHGAELARHAILGALAGLHPDVQRMLPDLDGIGIGAAGAVAAPDAVQRLIRVLRADFDAPVAVISDGLCAHVGAFAGGPGTVLIAGTGAVVFTLDDGGLIRQVDGLGPWLGDEGSGRWIGQQGLQAALRAGDGRGPETTLRPVAAGLAGGLAALPGWVSAAGSPARTVGTFAPTVITHASDGDGAATAIVAKACALLALACSAARPDGGRVCVTGGLVSHPYFRAALEAALTDAGLSLISPRGDALAGAALIVHSRALPHEKRIIRG